MSKIWLCLYLLYLFKSSTSQPNAPVKKNQENKQEKQKLDQLQFVQALGTPQLHRSDKQRIQDNNTELKNNNSTLFKWLKCSMKAVTSAGLNLPPSKSTISTISTAINSLNQITANLTPPSKSSLYISIHYTISLLNWKK